MAFIFPVLMLAAMYFMLVRPQQQRAKAQRALLASLAVGDEVVTVGGIVGTITSIDGDRIDADVGHDVTLTFLRPAIAQRISDIIGPEDGGG